MLPQVASKIQKSDNKTITKVLTLCFSSVDIAGKSALALDVHPAGLEPAIL
jgi:hypothetical protein